MKSDIRKISLLIRKQYYEDVLFQIGKSELIHLSRGKTDKIDMMDDETLKNENRVRNLLAVLQTIISDVNATIPEIDISIINNIMVHEALDKNLKEDESLLTTIRKKMDQYERIKNLITQKSESIEKELIQLEEIEKVLEKNDLQTGLTLLALVFGSISDGERSSLEVINENFIVKQFGQYVFGLSLRDKQNLMKKHLSTFGFVDRSEIIRSPHEIRNKIETLKKRKLTLEKRKIKINGALEVLKKKWNSSVISMYEHYFVLVNTYEARKNFLFSDEAVFINGWVNIEKKSNIEKMLFNICGDSYFINILSKKEMKQYKSEIPVVLKNFKLFKPFELLVKNMGLPENKEIDPTPFTAITYMLMFGVMFGDVGQGLVLAATGLILKLVARKKNITEGFLPDGGGILIFCGISAAIFGLLWGSVFSNEHLIHALWFHPMEHMMDLFFCNNYDGGCFYCHWFAI